MADAIRASATEAGADRLRWTSVPRWPAPELPAAASYLACGFGEAGGKAARDLLRDADPAVPVRAAVFADNWDPPAEARLRRLLGGCHAGVRIILAGPESVVLRAAAVARQLGATSEELVLLATETAAPATAGAVGPGSGRYVAGPAARRVFCAACRAPFDARAALGEVVTCPGCQAGLIVDCRFSRPHAAYFGWPTGLDRHR